MKFQFTSGWYIGQQCLTHHFENKFKIPQGGLEQFVILWTFTHISRSCSIPWVKLRTQQLLESSLPCQTLIPAQNLTYIKQTSSRITLINLVIGRMEGKEAAWWKRSETKIKSVFHFLLNLWGSLALPLLYITVWWLYHTAVTCSSGLIHLYVFCAVSMWADTKRLGSMPERRSSWCPPQCSATASNESPVTQ